MRSVGAFPASAACLVASAVSALAAPSTNTKFDTSKFKADDIIRRDVAVVGGGSGGTYSAISLKDEGKSVIVIEKKNRLGGHTETYTDPETNTPLDMGVLIWHNISAVTDYFERLNVPIAKSGGFFETTQLNFDFYNGSSVTNFYEPTQDEVSAAFAAYAAQRAKYPSLNDGIYLPSPVPEDLTMPFGEFVAKYKLEAALPTMFNYNPGVGNILANPTVEQFRYWTLNMVDSLSTGFMTTARHNSSELYANAAVELDGDVLYSSEVTSSVRSEGDAGVKLIVSTPSGDKLVLAKKLLVAIPPKLDFVEPLDLSQQEEKLFSKFVDAGYYVGIVKNSGFPDDTIIRNLAQTTEYNLPNLPGAYSFAPSGVPGLHMTTYGTKQSRESEPLSDEEVRADIFRTIKTLQKVHSDKFNQTEPEWVDYASHAPYSLQVSAADIKDEFYKKLYALQGLRNTYWTGAAWRGEDSSLIWKFSKEKVLPELLAGL